MLGDNGSEDNPILELEFTDANGEPSPIQFNRGLGISVGINAEYYWEPLEDYYHYKFFAAGAEFIDD